MDLDLFTELLKLALKYVENAQFLIMKAQQKCQKVKRSGSSGTPFPDRPGNRLPLHVTGATPWKTQFFPESALCS